MTSDKAGNKCKASDHISLVLRSVISLNTRSTSSTMQCVCVCVCVCVSDTRDADVNNPFHANGELRRKADFIITHSRISRTELHIADPDDDNSTTTTTTRTTSSRERDSTDSAPASPASHQQHHRRHDDETSVVTVTSSMTTPLHTSTAEKINIKKKQRCLLQ